ncbi:unnamed protein product [Spodoptera littoralis]|uniref:Uncharacterized protein n=1 Tax=Spodoptera littoralis TaxID=7109 RepID=A0A9P0I091_SPOLI|nr:unnamed protein product [Spodoptera littoralis]CAH1638741.1 unnamed protein product [Spodoptera littoralis]
MFKLVVLCAFFAAAAAEPGALIAAPITQYTTYLAPGSTTIAKQDSTVIHPSPLFYQAPLAYTHFIKKRSAQFPLAYASPAAYYPANYYAATTYKLPLVQAPSILPAPIASVPAVPAVHLIKKRSAPLFPTTYYAPTTYAATTPLLASTYTATAPVLAQAPVLAHTPVISQPLAYAHLIKKRSAGLLNTYIAPAAYSHQSRVDLQTSHIPYSSFAYSAPIAYSAPLAVSHLYK